MSIKKKSL